MRNEKAPKREGIISEGIKLFLRKGFNATTISDITDAVGVSKGAFYWHFASKDELLETIVERYELLFVDQHMESVLRAKGGFLSKIKYSHKYATEFALNNKDLCVGFTTIAAEMVGSGTKIEEKIRAIKEKHRAFYRRLLELGRKEDVVKDDIDIDLAAHAINAIHDGSLLEWYGNYDNIDGVQFALTYRNIVLAGILK